MEKLRVGIYGATGSVGLEAIESLVDHPWFEITRLYASERSAGKTYEAACRLDISSLPEEITKMIVQSTNIEDIPEDLDIAFFALSEDIAKEFELAHIQEFVKYMTVITTSSALRMQEKVPLIITEVNASHIELAEDYRKNFNTVGAPFPQCNCTAVPLTIVLKPLLDTVGIKEVLIDSYQAISGAGAKATNKWKEERMIERGLPNPFLISKPHNNPDLIYEGNVRPIGSIDSKIEEEKVKIETLKMLGKFEEGRIKSANFSINCMCNRVPTLRGHYEHIRIKPNRSCSVNEIKSIFEDFNRICRREYGSLPSSPENTIILLDRQPQTRVDVNLGGGMSTVVGGIEIENEWIQLRALSDNLRKGAAKGSVQLMEYLCKSGFI